jgi:hypothetical protein
MNLPSRFLLIAGLIFLCTAGFTARTVNTPAKPRPKQSFLKMAPIPHPAGQAKTQIGQLYYWYAPPYDWYNDRKTLPDETYELWVMYGCLIDQDPSSSGILVMKGYFNNAYPHNQFPQVLLYAHYQ